MDLDVTHISGGTPIHDVSHRQVSSGRDVTAEAKEVARKLADAAADTAEERRQNRADVERYLKDIINYTEFFNKRLKFSINEELNRVVVKVIDGKTDKVIKEIPPEVLQRLYVRIREAIGLLVDEMI
jgi:flagellar protein FlaG